MHVEGNPDAFAAAALLGKREPVPSSSCPNSSGCRGGRGGNMCGFVWLRALDFFVNFLWGILLFFFPAREMEWGGCKKKSGEGGEEGERPCNYRGGPDYCEVVAHVEHMSGGFRGTGFPDFFVVCLFACITNSQQINV